MSTTSNSVGSPPQANDIENTQGRNDYLFLVGFFLMLILIFLITYSYYLCKRSLAPQSLTNYDDVYEDHPIGLSRGLDDDVLVTFPTFVYSEVTMDNKKGDSAVKGPGCSICLADYKATDVIRLLPECRHLFHVNCIDKWLKAHPSCPVCRNSPLAGKVHSAHLTDQVE
ncbi:RING-H2 finger protein ATL70-like protein [Tanacetum coccineum]